MYSDVFLRIFVFICFYKFSQISCKMEGKVVGGNLTTIRMFPHAIFLFIDCQGAKFFCGSSVLNQVVLLTAAHCFEMLNNKSIVKAYGGHHDINKVTLVRDAKRVYKHKNYSKKSVINDIALVKLKHELPLGNYIKRVILLPNTAKQNGILAGWGAVDAEMTEFTYKLKVVQQKIRSRDVCARIGDLHPGMICAGSLNQNVSRPARGDSGSGLVTNDYQIVGLVSHVVYAFPALTVYTNVSYYYKWIQEKSQKIICPY